MSIRHELILPINNNNNNGTPAGELVYHRRAAINLIDMLTSELQRVTPNGRDYPGETKQLDRDRRIHFDRLDELNELRRTLTEEALYIKRRAAGED